MNKIFQFPYKILPSSISKQFFFLDLCRRNGIAPPTLKLDCRRFLAHPFFMLGFYISYMVISRHIPEAVFFQNGHIKAQGAAFLCFCYIFPKNDIILCYAVLQLFFYTIFQYLMLENGPHSKRCQFFVKRLKIYFTIFFTQEPVLDK